MNRVLAQGFFGVMVSTQLRQKKMGPEELAKKASLHPLVVVGAAEGKADPNRQQELRRLIAVLFHHCQRRKRRAHRLLRIFVVPRRQIRGLPYNNQNRYRRDCGRRF
jgi:hypothetical protein